MYEPAVDDYVIWNRPNGDKEEGWVYFKGDPVAVSYTHLRAHETLR